MNKKTELVYAINALFAAGKEEKLDPSKIPQRLETLRMMDDLDYDALLQSLHFNQEIVYAYTAEGVNIDSSCNYNGLELFPRMATLIDTRCVRESLDVVLTSRTLELWMLDDFSFALVANTETDFAEGLFHTAYRVVRATDLDEIVQEMALNLDRIACTLVELAESYGNLGSPTYEL